MEIDISNSNTSFEKSSEIADEDNSNLIESKASNSAVPGARDKKVNKSSTIDSEVIEDRPLKELWADLVKEQTEESKLKAKSSNIS